MTIDLSPALAAPFTGLADETEYSAIMARGKVRDIVDLGDRVALVATDRISAFDRVLGTVPYRGQVLNQLAAWWFDKIEDIVGSHVVDVPDPNVTVGTKCRTIPVEVVVRARLSGSTSTALWTRYAAGDRSIYGIRFLDGLVKNAELARPVITPTTKAIDGAHDEPITEAEIVERGLVKADLWDQVRSTALEVFDRGARVARDCGLTLVDTKYEFGLDAAGELVIIDEVHTPDSSRFWRSTTVEERLDQGLEPENMDKEVLRLRLAERGYRGEGTPPELDAELACLVADVYLEAFEMLTGAPLDPAPYPANHRVDHAIRALL